MGITGAISSVAGNVYNWITGGIGSIADKITDTAKGLFSLGQWIYRAFVDGLEWIYKAFSDLGSSIKNGLISAYDKISGAISSFGSWLYKGLSSMASELYNALSTAYNYLKEALETTADKLYNAIEDAVNIVRDLAHWIWTNLTNLAHWIYDKLVAFVKYIVKFFWRIISGIADILERFFNWVKSKIYQAYTDMSKAVSGYFTNLLTTAKDKFSELVMFNITWDGLQKGIPLFLEGKYKDGARHIILSPILGALGGAFVQEMLSKKQPAPEKIVFTPVVSDMEQYDVFNIQEGSYIEFYGSLKIMGNFSVEISGSVAPINIKTVIPVRVGVSTTISITKPINIVSRIPIVVAPYVDISVVSTGGGYYYYGSSY